MCVSDQERAIPVSVLKNAVQQNVYEILLRLIIILVLLSHVDCSIKSVECIQYHVYNCLIGLKKSHTAVFRTLSKGIFYKIVFGFPGKTVEHKITKCDLSLALENRYIHKYQSQSGTLS